MMLKDLIVTQSMLRNCQNLNQMVQFVNVGGFWNKTNLELYALKNSTRISPLIAISKFEDGNAYIHDGHHRVVATCLAGREYLRKDEFVVLNWKYEEYLEIAPENNWYTPFDPRIHIRNFDISEFKKEAKMMFEQDASKAVDWILNHVSNFRSERNIWTVDQLCSSIQSSHPSTLCS